MPSILIIDDEKAWLKSLKLTLSQYSIADYVDIYTAINRMEALNVLAAREIDLILLDLMMGNEKGEDTLCVIKKVYPSANIIIMTGNSSIQSAINCIEKGAMDYLIKAAPVDDIVNSLQKSLNTIAQKKDTEKTADTDSNECQKYFSGFVTASPEMHQIFKYLCSTAASQEPLLITGQSGVGKGILAKCVAAIARPGQPFISINVAGLDADVFADTLFGHVAGAFTSANERRAGMVQNAGNGVLCLDEIGDLDPQSQTKLLYLAQTGEYQQLGSDRIFKSNAKMIFSTNCDLEDKINDGSFRHDLYYRLKTHHVHIPSLMDRPEDIPLLIKHFIHKAAEDYKICDPVIDESAVILLKSYLFPGNTRELRAMIYDAVAECNTGVLSFADFKKHLRNHDAQDAVQTRCTEINFDDVDELPKVETIINGLVDIALSRANGNQSKAASMIGLSQSTLSKRLKKKK